MNEISVFLAGNNLVKTKKEEEKFLKMRFKIYLWKQTTRIHRIFETNFSFHVEYEKNFSEAFWYTDKIFISGIGLSTKQKASKILRFSWYFLIS